MKEFINFVNTSELKFSEESVVIGDDLALFVHNAGEVPICEPRRFPNAAIMVCTAGACRIKINLQEYEVEAPMQVTLMPGQIIEVLDTSPNFKTYTIAVSKRFIDMINLPGWQQKYIDMYNNPITPLEEDQLTVVRIFFLILHRAASNTENPFRLQVIENLIRVFYYGGVSATKCSERVSPYKNTIVERFIELVHKHYREERMISFYAEHLCITPKYLSKIVKENTGRSAGEWIESHVILDARAMLQSSDMTIQQIAASLNFPNQSFFGKYFKRATGQSPKQYRHGGEK